LEGSTGSPNDDAIGVSCWRTLLERSSEVRQEGSPAWVLGRPRHKGANGGALTTWWWWRPEERFLKKCAAARGRKFGTEQILRGPPASNFRKKMAYYPPSPSDSRLFPQDRAVSADRHQSGGNEGSKVPMVVHPCPWRTEARMILSGPFHLAKRAMAPTVAQGANVSIWRRVAVGTGAGDP